MVAAIGTSMQIIDSSLIRDAITELRISTQTYTSIGPTYSRSWLQRNLRPRIAQYVSLAQSPLEWPSVGTFFACLAYFATCIQQTTPIISPRKDKDGKSVQSAGTACTFRRHGRFVGL